MASTTDTTMVTERPCIICDSVPLCLSDLADHMLTKKHVKKFNERSLLYPQAPLERSIKIKGFYKVERKNAIDQILNAFWKFDFINVNFQPDFTLLEFETKESAAKMLDLKEEFVVNNKVLMILPPDKDKPKLLLNKDCEDTYITFKVSDTRSFAYSPKGELEIQLTKLDNPSTKNECVKDFIIFLLKHCLKCVILESNSVEVNTESELDAAKRKSCDFQEGSPPNKVMKTNDGQGMSTDQNLSMIATYRCKTEGSVWECRKKGVYQQEASNSEVAFTVNQVSLSDVIFKARQGQNKPSLEFEVTLWKEDTCKDTFSISCRCISVIKEESCTFLPCFKFLHKVIRSFNNHAQRLIKQKCS